MKPAKKGMIATARPATRTSARSTEIRLPSARRTRRRIRRMPGVWPTALQKSAKYTAAAIYSPAPSSAPTSQWGRIPPTSEPISATIPTPAAKTTTTMRASTPSAIARETRPA